VKDNEAAVITRDRAVFHDVRQISKDNWYVLETNYDYWNPVPENDNRRDQVIKLLEEVGRERVNGNEIYKVLSAPVIFRKGKVIYTSIMNARHEDYKTVIRDW